MKLILFLSSVPLISFFVTSDLPHTHDGPVHLARMAAYYKALVDWQILPRWAGDLNYGYGLPLFNFIYHTPYLVSSLFLALGVGLVTTFKLVMAISYLAAGVFMYQFAKAFFKNENVALVTTVLYQFAPFRLVELAVRGSFGELFTYTFLPLTLLGITRLMESFLPRYLLLTAVGSFLLIISHNSVSLVYFGICIAFSLFFAKKKRVFVIAATALLVGLLLSSFYWLPALFEHKYTYGNLFMKDLYKTHFVPLAPLLFPNITNDPAFHVGGVSVQIGLAQTVALAATVLFFFRKKKDKVLRRLFAFCLLLFAGSVVFMTEISRSAWENIAFLRQFQFPWRFLSVVLLLSALSARFLFEFKWFQKSFPIFLGLAVLATVAFWKPPLGYDRLTNEAQFWNYPLNTTYFGETDLIWSAGPAKRYPNAPAEIVEGKGQVENIMKRSNLHTYTVRAASGVRLVDHTQYFPGWRVYVDRVKVPIEFQDQNWRGLITYIVPEGSHRVKVSFEKSKVQLLGELLSATTLAALALLWIFRKRKI